MVEISQVSFVHLARHAGFMDLTREYDAECSIKNLPPIDWQSGPYIALEKTGLYKCLVAREQGVALGFAGIIISNIPHYNRVMATTESIFVGSAYRKKGVGLKLIKAAEQLAKDEGCVALFLTAPHGSRLTQLAPAIGYEKTNEVFTKVL